MSPGQLYPWHQGQGQPLLTHAQTSPGQMVHSPWQNLKTDNVKNKSFGHGSESPKINQQKIAAGSEKVSDSKSCKVTFTLTDSESSRSSSSGFSEHVTKTTESYASVCSNCQATVADTGQSGINKGWDSRSHNMTSSPDLRLQQNEKQGGNRGSRNNRGKFDGAYNRDHVESDQHYRGRGHSNKDNYDHFNSHSRRDYGSNFRGQGRDQGRGQGYHGYDRDQYHDNYRDHSYGRRYSNEHKYDRGRGQSQYRDRGYSNYRGQNQRYPSRGRGRARSDFHPSHSEPLSRFQRERSSYDKNVNIRRAVSAQENTGADSFRANDSAYGNSRGRSYSDYSDTTEQMSNLTLEEENIPKERTSSDSSDKKSDTLFRSPSNESNQTSSSNSAEWCNVTKKSGKKKGWVDSPDNYAQDKRYAGDRYGDRSYSHSGRFNDKRGRGRGNRFYETGDRDRQRYGQGFERNERPS